MGAQRKNIPEHLTEPVVYAAVDSGVAARYSRGAFYSAREEFSRMRVVPRKLVFRPEGVLALSGALFFCKIS